MKERKSNKKSGKFSKTFVQHVRSKYKTVVAALRRGESPYAVADKHKLSWNTVIAIRDRELNA